MYAVVQINQPTIGFKGAGHLREYIENMINEGSHDIIIDLSQLIELGSVGIGVFFSVAKKLKALDGDLKLIGASPSVYKALNMVSIPGIIETHQKS